jgi:hypothetical protein
MAKDGSPTSKEALSSLEMACERLSRHLVREGMREVAGTGAAPVALAGQPSLTEALAWRLAAALQEREADVVQSQAARRRAQDALQRIQVAAERLQAAGTDLADRTRASREVRELAANALTAAVPDEFVTTATRSRAAAIEASLEEVARTHEPEVATVFDGPTLPGRRRRLPSPE